MKNLAEETHCWKAQTVELWLVWELVSKTRRSSSNSTRLSFAGVFGRGEVLLTLWYRLKFRDIFIFCKRILRKNPPIIVKFVSAGKQGTQKSDNRFETFALGFLFVVATAPIGRVATPTADGGRSTCHDGDAKSRIGHHDATATADRGRSTCHDGDAKSRIGHHDETATADGG